MKQAGRMFLPIIAVVVIVVGGGVFLFLAGGSPSAAANQFMFALAKGNTKDLTRLGYIDGVTPAQEEEIWKKTVDRAQYYRFVFHIKNSTQATPDTASVAMDFSKNADTPAAFVETYTLPMTRIDGVWKVDVRQISRDMYPALPR